MRHIISALVDNKPGVLARIASLFSARGYNIESLAVGRTEEGSPDAGGGKSDRSRMTIVVNGDDRVIEQIRKQLDKLVDTYKVTDLSDTPAVERDLALVRLKLPPQRRGEVIELVEIFRGHIVDVTEKQMIVEVSGDEEKISAFLRVLKPFGISEMARTGRIALRRGE